MKLRTTTFVMMLLAMLFVVPSIQVQAQSVFSGRIKTIRIKKRRVGSGFKVISKITTKPGSTASYIQTKMEPADNSSPKPSMSSFSQSISSSKKGGSLVVSTEMSCEKVCLFGKDVNPVGKKYKLTSTIYNSKKVAISEAKVQEVTIEEDNSDCKIKYAFHHASFSGVNFYASFSEKNGSDYPLFVKRNGAKSNSIVLPVSFTSNSSSEISASISIHYSTLKDTATTYSEHSYGTFDEKSNAFVFSWPNLESALVKCIKVSSTICADSYKEYLVNFNRVEAVEEDAISFKLNKLGKNSNKVDPFCKDSMLVLEKGVSFDSKIAGSFQIFNVSGVKFSLAGKAITDAEVEAVLSLTDCKGGQQNIAIALKYNDKTGEYANSKALALCGDKGMTFNSMDVFASYKRRKDKLRASYREALRSEEL